MLPLDLSQASKDRIKLLEDKISLIHQAFSTLQVIGPIEFSLNDPKTFLEKIKQIDKETGINQKPLVYIYEIENHEEHCKQLLKQWKAHRDNLNPDSKLFAMARVNEERVNDTKALYVGSVQKNVLSRIKQHLGLSNTTKTYAMHLTRWVTDCPLIRFYYLPLPDATMTYEVEAAIAFQLKPLLGKADGI